MKSAERARKEDRDMTMFHFGVGAGRVSSREEKRIDAAIVAAGYGPDDADTVHFIAVEMPGGPSYWFSGPNNGAPFDQRMAREVMAKVGRVATE